MRGMLLGILVVVLVAAGAFPTADFDAPCVLMESDRLKASGSICIVVVVVIEDW